MRREQLFFPPSLEIQAEAKEGERNKPCKPAIVDDQSQNHEKQAAVDGVANIAVRAALDEFVVFFDDNVGTPISAQGCPRPKRDKKAAQRDDIRDDSDKKGVPPEERSGTYSQWPPKHKEQHEGDDKGNGTPLASTLSLEGGLGRRCGDNPVQDNNHKTEIDKLCGDIWHGWR